MTTHEMTCIVEENTRIAPHVSEVTLSVPPESGFTFLPGQWVNLDLPAEDGRPRKLVALSMVSTPRSLPRLTLCVKDHRCDGTKTDIFDGLAAGHSVTVKGPFGKFYVPQDCLSHLLFMATGVGMSPALSILRGLVEADEIGKRKVLVLWGCRSEEDLYYVDDIRVLEREFPNVHFKICLSQPSPKWKGTRGYITNALRSRLKHFENMEVFLSGLQKMIVDAKGFLESNGVASERIHREPFY